MIHPRQMRKMILMKDILAKTPIQQSLAMERPIPTLLMLPAQLEVAEVNIMGTRAADTTLRKATLSTSLTPRMLTITGLTTL